MKNSFQLSGLLLNNKLYQNFRRTSMYFLLSLITEKPALDVHKKERESQARNVDGLSLSERKKFERQKVTSLSPPQFFSS
eukprot:UN00297